MRYRAAVFLLLALLTGCGGLDGKKYTVAFQPFSLELDPQAQATVRAAAAFANANVLMPISIAGYATPIDTGDFDTLRQQRVALVQAALVQQGVDRMRIEILGNGILYPDGVPNQPAGKILVSVGL
jgi:outer membrane protein OmpA-like peptidoglycan-associated protein